MHSIEIDDEVMEVLKARAEPFVDTPNTVLRRLLELDAKVLNAMSRRGAQYELPKGRSSRKRRRIAALSLKASRAPAGAILPEQEYMLPLLQVLHAAGGRAPAQEVIEQVGQRLGTRLTDLDRGRLTSGGLRWHNRVQFTRLKLIERGLLKKGSPRGLWELSDRGVDLIVSEQKAQHA